MDLTPTSHSAHSCACSVCHRTWRPGVLQAGRHCHQWAPAKTKFQLVIEIHSSGVQVWGRAVKWSVELDDNTKHSSILANSQLQQACLPHSFKYYGCYIHFPPPRCLFFFNIEMKTLAILRGMHSFKSLSIFTQQIFVVSTGRF